MPEESRVTVGPTMPIAPIPVVPAPPTLASLCNFLTLIPYSIKTFVIAPSIFFIFTLRAYIVSCILFQVHLLPRWLWPLWLRLVAVLPPFPIMWVRLLPTLPVLNRPRPMILTLPTLRVLDLLMLTSMAFEYLSSALRVWRQFTATVGISCRDSLWSFYKKALPQVVGVCDEWHWT